MSPALRLDPAGTGIFGGKKRLKTNTLMYHFSQKTGALALALLLSLPLAAQNYIEITQKLLQAKKNGGNAQPYVEAIAQADPQDLAATINTDRERLAFWINLYNGLIQYHLAKNPDYYEDRDDFFSADILTVAGAKVSFDNLEHGVLRRGTSKYSMGYFSNPFGSDWHEPYQVDEIDWRIHFALNCGAASCPPVRIYDAASIDRQLNASTNQYLSSNVRYVEAENTVYVPALFSWFRGDFGGLDGALQILENRAYIPNTDVELEFNEYDWTLKIGPEVFYKQ